MVIDHSSIVPAPRAMAVIALVAIANAFSFFQQMPDHDLTGWDARVVRNWDECGYGALHGRVVDNPGGIAPGERLHIYPGYRGFSLLPLYVLYLATGSLWWSRLIFFVLLSLGLCFSIWWMLHQTVTALAAAVALCLSPGFVRWGIAWDPVPGTIFLGVPVILALVHVANPDTHPKSTGPLAAMSLATVLYAQIEWGAVFALFIGWWALLVLLWRGHRLRLGLVTLALLVGAQIGAVWLIGEKMSLSTGGHGLNGLIGYFREYNFGSSGYGKGQITWPLAFKRVAVACAVGLAPLWVVFVAVIRHAWSRLRSGVIVRLVPLAAALFASVVMRNAMAEHQWIPCSFVGLGVLVSLQLIHQPLATDSAAGMTRPVTQSMWFLALLIAAAILYGRIIGGINRAKDARFNALLSLVENHTPRSATVCLGPDLEQQFPLDRAQSVMDRHTYSFSDCPDTGGGQSAFIVNSKPMPGYGTPVAAAVSEKKELWSELLSWYRVRVTQRRPTEFLQSDSYFLYKRAGAPSPSK
jgi:hypothetical protein